jgi:protein-disulfide isomerase
VKRLAIAAVLCALSAGAFAAQFGPSQHPLQADDGTPMTNFDMTPALLSQLEMLPGKVPVGNAKGDVTLYQFYDLNCPFCREAAADVQEILKTDKKLKLVFVPYAVLSVQSVQGAMVEIVVAKMLSPEKFLEFHKRIYEGRGTIDGARAIAAAQAMGLDGKAIVERGNTPETVSVLKQNADYGQAAKLIATPDYVIAGVAILGHPGLEPLKNVIAAVRKCGKVICGKT